MKTNPKTLILIAIIAIPVICLGVALTGAAGFWFTSAITSADSSSGSARSGMTAIDAEVLAIAADYNSSGDLEAARTQLLALNLPNPEQYVSFMLDRYIQEGHGIGDVDAENLFGLADALGTSTGSQIAALSTPTPPPTPTPLPTDTPLPPTPTPSPTATVPPTDTPVPDDTPTPTDTPAPPPAPEPGPPTDTPEPTPTPEPERPAVDFVVAEAYLIPNPSYNSCPGAQQIYVTVVDVNGNPLDGATVEDTWNAVPPKISGEKGPGKLEYDLWQNGFSLHVTKNSDGSPATSDVTPVLSSVDEQIPNEWLIQANYCRDMDDCVARKSNNQLCRGHYAYNVTFKKTY